MPTFIRLPPPELQPTLRRDPDSLSTNTPSISEWPSSRTSMASSSSFLMNYTPIPPSDSQSYFAPPFASPRHTCDRWQSWVVDDSTEALLPSSHASSSHDRNTSKSTRLRSGTETSDDSWRSDPDCAVCRSSVTIKRAVTREDVIDSWMQKLPSRNTEWDATSQASGVTVSSAGTGFFSIEGAEDTSEWFIPFHGPNVETGPNPSGRNMQEDDSSDMERDIALGPRELSEGRIVDVREVREYACRVEVPRSKRTLRRKVLKTMLPCFPVP
ncbi:uncharacterized protein PHACADRAFT_265255 [Phanerochaete carnosa HHB-10118-sp]|uniref:Uncharacterized protein n=1 Tax=Phanerochaete carnosa (strain HHB-10118-sp) TaxID=650164 RepID=K5WHI6_PHACS|nr:uncharacterized protein PHACADRAFT_265255 [Phanerochaete carnosa HHB-10118-sp]EKM49687.1 hypothetical protein PHACADRAFT_265255 [Phanerochaete carnosa HHB-10118-sp]